MDERRKDLPRSRTGPVPSGPSRIVPPRPSEYSPLPKRDEAIPKREEKWLVSSAIGKCITGIVRGSPSCQTAPTMLYSTSASSSSRRLSASKTESPSIVQRSSMLKTAPTLSSWSSPTPNIRPCPSGSSSLPEGDKTSFKMEERQLDKTAVSQNMTSVERHSFSHQEAPMLPRSKTVENVTKCCCN
jgi:hypothetical protein